MKNSIKLVPLVVSTLVATIGLTVLTQDSVLIAQNKPANSGETRSQTLPSSNTETNNLPTRGVNDPNNPTPAPPKKGGANARGGQYSCELRFNNSTPWFVDLYANDQFLGTIAPYGDAVIPATAGGFRLLGRAEFDDRSVRTWGPQMLSLSPGEFYKWTLLP